MIGHAPAQAASKRTTSNRTGTGQLQRLLLLASLLLGLALRLYRLGVESLWYDETVSVFLARQSLPNLIAHTARDIHPPGYYLLLHFWQQVTAPTLAHGLEFLYAWPSLFCGMLLLPLLYAIGRRLLGGRIALLAVGLAAINPYQVWYSQEVRMYTLGALLGLLCLWAVVKWRGGHHVRNRWLWLYAIAAALGLYTLYYFAFLLLALNGLVLWQQASAYGRSGKVGRSLWTWLATQLAVLVLWLPWLPTFWRQISQPPVPSWRGQVDLLQVIRESLAALLVGQSPPGGELWIWALVVTIILFVAFYYYTKTDRPTAIFHFHPVLFLLGVTFLPLLAIYLLGQFLTPLYHVRYFFIYATPALLLLATGIHALWRWRWLSVLMLAAAIAVSSWGLAEFWGNPLYRADDHRAAVADLAANWRPGDLILVNAGWVYTALTIYWPTELNGVDSSLPPPIERIVRLTDYTNKSNEDSSLDHAQPAGPLVLQAGSVDGPASLGWGSPQSDFYAMDRAQAAAALAQVAQHHPRIWHYRLYDTVNDPEGFIRNWLAQNSQLLLDQAYPGRDFLRLQLYETKGATPMDPARQADGIEFDSALRLDGHTAPAEAVAGQQLYVDLYWTALPGLARLADELHMSLRLYTDDGDDLAMPVAQSDSAPRPPTSKWTDGQTVRQPLALSLPAATKPGRYRLELVVYRAGDSAPLTLPPGPGVVYGQRWRLGTIAVQPPAQPPHIQKRPLGVFDYIELLAAQTAPIAHPGGSLPVQLTWRPRPNGYRDTYVERLVLRSPSGETVQIYQAPAGGSAYPSGIWPATYPVREWRQIPLPPDLPPGRYTLSIGLARASDGLVVSARTKRWWPWATRERVDVGAVAVRDE